MRPIYNHCLQPLNFLNWSKFNVPRLPVRLKAWVLETPVVGYYHSLPRLSSSSSPRARFSSSFFLFSPACGALAREDSLLPLWVSLTRPCAIHFVGTQESDMKPQLQTCPACDQTVRRRAFLFCREKYCCLLAERGYYSVWRHRERPTSFHLQDACSFMALRLLALLYFSSPFIIIRWNHSCFFVSEKSPQSQGRLWTSRHSSVCQK